MIGDPDSRFETAATAISASAKKVRVSSIQIRSSNVGCGRSDLPLEVHHVNGNPMDNRIINTIPLCRDCHRKAT